MKKVLAVIMCVLLIMAASVIVNAEEISISPLGEKVVFTDGDWAYEKVNNYGWELDEYIGSAADVSLPWSFAKEYVTSIGSYAFINNTTVRTVDTTGKLEAIGDYAFNGCSSLQTVTLYDGLTSLGIGCFYGCSSLSDVNLQDTVVSEIPSYCFAECGISELALPDSCTKIDSLAFYNCSSLTKLTIPESVTEISSSAFTGCSGIVIYCYAGSAAQSFAQANGISFVLIDPQPTEPTGYILGDTDDSGDVDVVDATWIQRYAAQIEVTPVAATLMQGDVDADGEPTVIDATFIMRYTVNIATPYAIGERVVNS